MTMYMALYRQWRPKSFADMVGQEHVCQTLVSALERDMVAHAYLFSGPRGTGKTTVARLLAKALNCVNRQGIEPCKSCASCRETDQGVALDVAEIDAASNRGIDEIRDLREKVRLASAGGRYKVYIIDEVHMLTAEAFNALLKTLEDPPEGVVFILATTEAHRVPATILSRVQHFEFRRIALEDIKNRLRRVCEALGREVDDEALHVIALKGEGGLRDALSILDQCLNREGRLGVLDILRQLGMMGESGSADLVEGLLHGGYADVLRQMDENMSLGRDPRQILRELLDYMRDMMIFLAGGSLPPRAPEALERIGRQAEQATLARVLAWIHLLLKGEADLKYAPNARLAVEMLLVQAIYAGYGDNSEGEAAQEPCGLSDISLGPALKRTEASPKRAEASPKRGEASSKRTEPIQQQAEFTPKRPGPDPKPDPKQSEPAQSTTVPPSKKAESDQKTSEPIQQQIEFTPKTWEDILALIRSRSKPVHAFLLAGEPYFTDGKLQVIFPRSYAFHCEMLNQEIHKNTLFSAVCDVMGRKVPVEGIVGSVPQTAKEDSHKPVNTANVNEKNTNSTAADVVEKAVEIFGADVVVVREEKK
jgi:DNA polymerase-3 subunit gamma/tau